LKPEPNPKQKKTYLIRRFQRLLSPKKFVLKGSDGVKQSFFVPGPVQQLPLSKAQKFAYEEAKRKLVNSNATGKLDGGGFAAH
jgi:hypothetical protein